MLCPESEDVKDNEFQDKGSQPTVENVHLTHPCHILRTCTFVIKSVNGTNVKLTCLLCVSKCKECCVSSLSSLSNLRTHVRHVPHVRHCLLQMIKSKGKLFTTIKKKASNDVSNLTSFLDSPFDSLADYTRWPLL